MEQPRSATSGATATSDDPLVALQEVEQRLAALADSLRPECIPGHRLPAITKALTGVERRTRGMRLVLRKAAADTGDWKAKGHRSPADQVAKEEGISTGQAKREIEASGRLADLPAAREAVGRGEISPESAAVVAEGAAADPDAESSLVRTAKRGDLQATRKRAQDVIAKADERSGERARRIYERRCLKTWVTIDGEGHGQWNVPPEMHARFMAALAPYREAAFRAARAAGDRLSLDQLMADALDMLMRDVLLDHAADAAEARAADGAGVADDVRPGPTGEAAATSEPASSGAATGSAGRSPSLFDGPGDVDPSSSTGPALRERTVPGGRVVPTAGRRPSTPAARNRRAPAQVHVLVDFDALRRGFASDGETCEIHGIGAIPVSLAEHLMQDSLLRLVVTGTDVTKVSSQKRDVPEAVRRALFARDKGCCVVCGADRYLELHHFVTDHAQGGPTEYANLAHVCSREHALITYCGWSLHQTDDGWDLRPPGPAPGPDPP